MIAVKWHTNYTTKMKTKEWLHGAAVVVVESLPRQPPSILPSLAYRLKNGDVWWIVVPVLLAGDRSVPSGGGRRWRREYLHVGIALCSCGQVDWRSRRGGGDGKVRFLEVEFGLEVDDGLVGGRERQGRPVDKDRLILPLAVVRLVLLVPYTVDADVAVVAPRTVWAVRRCAARARKDIPTGKGR